MLTTIRYLVACQPGNAVRSRALIRLASSFQDREKEQSVKAKDFLVDPNLVKAFKKLKEGDFTITPIDKNSIKRLRPDMDVDEPTRREPRTRNQRREDFLGKLVYTGKLDGPFRAAKSLSLASSIGGAICYPIMLPKILAESSIVVAIGYSIISTTFVLFTPTLMQLISKRYLTSIYFHEDKAQFTAYYKNFFMMERQVLFRAEDVQVPPVTGMFTSMLIKNKPYFINHDDFTDKAVLMKMLGYDKEFDFDQYTKDVKALDNDDDDDDDVPVNQPTKKKKQM